jgi:hypothetical protein
MKIPASREEQNREFGNLKNRFQRAIHLTIMGGAEHYRRQTQLPLLIGGEFENSEENASETLRIVRRLSRAIRHERQLGRAGHWAYDLNRHIGLRQALRAELANLRKLKGKQAQQASD